MPVTLIENVHWVLWASVAPLRDTAPLPATAVIVPPPQLPARPLGVETTRPAGKLSVNPIPVKLAAALLFWIVNVSEVEAPVRMLAAPNALMMTGGLGVLTMTLADAVPPMPLSVAVTWLVVLFFTPAVAPVTLIEKVQDELWASVAPLKDAELLPAIAVIVPPPQLPARPFGVDTTNPAGKLSLKPIPVRLAAALLF